MEEVVVIKVDLEGDLLTEEPHFPEVEREVEVVAVPW